MRSIWSLILLGSLITYHCLTTVSGEESHQSTEASNPTFESCKPYVDAALKSGGPAEGDDESGEGGTEEQASSEDGGEPPDESVAADSEQDSTEEDQNDSKQEEESGEEGADEKSEEESSNPESEENTTEETTEDGEQDDSKGDAADDSQEQASEEDKTEEEKSAEDEQSEQDVTQEEDQADSTEEAATAETAEGSQEGDSEEDKQTVEGDSTEEKQSAEGDSTEDKKSEGDSGEDKPSEGDEPASTEEADDATKEESAEEDGGEKTSEEVDESSEQVDSKEDEEAKTEEDDKSTDGNTQEDSGEEAKSDGSVSSDVADEADQSQSGESQEDKATQEDQASAEDSGSPETEAAVSGEEGAASAESEEATSEGSEEAGGASEEEEEEAEPYEPRSRDHLINILGLDDSELTKTTSNLLDKATQSTLKELKSTYENAIKPLEQMYKYRDLSNRHFGDPEIFSKPLIVFMGPWSGGKSTIINWLLGIQHDDTALRTGADPSPAQFNIMMYGKEPEKLDGTQLAADWTFSGLQKFGQSFLDRLRGQKLPNRLLEKVNIVEIPGILEVRKQVERSFPFNDACQWFIDRADTLFLIYDPAKLDIGPETEAILDQLKGRENQVRIVLNKADTVKPDELMRVQAMLVWNISPLMSSAEPPVLYAASLWDRPLQVESPKSLLVAHENNFLKDIKDGIERRVETRIAAARRFAVRVRNHAKMVDCYLNTYNNHKSFFSDKKKISTDIIDHPQNYHIYEGLSTLTNISRYDLPDPDTYRDFFRINPIWDFPTLQSTCSFWKGCPLHKLDIAIAYDLPEILGKFRRQREAIVSAKSSSKK